MKFKKALLLSAFFHLLFDLSLIFMSGSIGNYVSRMIMAGSNSNIAYHHAMIFLLLITTMSASAFIFYKKKYYYLLPLIGLLQIIGWVYIGTLV